MVKIRLKRLGSKRNPIYRVIVIDGREKREGRPIEELGFYNPRKKELKLDKTKALEWVKKGANPSETVNYLINNSDDEGNLIRKQEEGQKLSKKAKAKEEAEAKAKEEAEAKAKEEAEAKAKEEAEAKAKEEAETKAKEEAEAKAKEEAEAETKEEAEAEAKEEAEAETKEEAEAETKEEAKSEA